MRKLCFTVITLFLVVPQLVAQKYEAALEKLAAQSQPEKIYIHYDKEYYVAGETIWFKAYLYSDGKPSAAANNLYLQFTDSKGRLISTKKFPVLGAVAKGNILIPDSLSPGNYYLRALTPEMLNYDEAFIYKKDILVFKPAQATVEKPAPPNVSVKFFPESGDMVDGILTVVGFKAVDQAGIPVEINGTIRTDEGATIASFKSYHDGIGKLPFKPQAGKKYIAEVETPAGKRTYSLPEVKTMGINLKVQDEKGGKKFQLSRSEKDKALFKNLWVVAEINNHVIYENEIDFEDYPSVVGHLVTDSLPSGILHFTIFNNEGVPLAERLSFVDNQEYKSDAKITTQKLSVEKRAENTIELSFADPVQRSCSVSVTDASGNGFTDTDNIWSRFLLTSDLKGYIYNPAWYFAAHNDTTKQAIDNLLLTHGWSRFNWTKVLANELPVNKYSDQPLISITGKVSDEKNKETLPGGTLSIYLEAEDSSTQNFDIPVDVTGKFRIDSLLFRGKTKLFYGYTDSKGKVKNAIVHLDDHPVDQIIMTVPIDRMDNMFARDVNSIEGKDVNTRYSYVISRMDEIKELEKVTVLSKSNKKPIDLVNEKYASGVFKTPGKVEIDNINEPATDKSVNVVDYVKNRIQQLELQGGHFVNRKNMSLMTGQKWPVGIFLDEVPADINQLRVLRMNDVALVKFYEAGFVGVGSGSPGGALVVYTRDKSNKDAKPDKLSFVEYNGYSIVKEFYMPDYANKEMRQPITDNRTTLYWNPDIYTDADSPTLKFNFFNNDFSKKFKVVVEGFDAMGKLIHAEKIIGN